MKILYLAHRIPYPPNKGDKIRSFNEIKYLSKGNEIHLACLADDPNDLKYQDDLVKYCKSVNVVLINPKLAKIKSVLYLFSKTPLSVPYFYSSRLQMSIDHLLSTIDFNVIFCFSSPMAEYLFKSIARGRRSMVKKEPSTNLPPTIDHQPSTKLIMDFVDVDSDKWAQYSKYATFPKSWVYGLESRRLSVYERKVAESFDHSIFVTDAEVRVFKRNNPAIQNITAISNGVDLDYFSPNYHSQPSPIAHRPSTIPQPPAPITQPPAPINEQPVLLFTGAMDYYANIDGVLWFAKEILPLIKREIPGVRFFIVGSNPAKEILSLNNEDGIVVTGYVKDIRSYYKMADLGVIPLRLARGIQNKVLEAMAMCLPVVATSQAFEGINAKVPKDLLVEDEPSAFSKAVLEIIKTPSLRSDLKNNARRAIETNYSWARNLAQLDELIH